MILKYLTFHSNCLIERKLEIFNCSTTLPIYLSSEHCPYEIREIEPWGVEGRRRREGIACAGDGGVTKAESLLRGLPERLEAGDRQ
jgi:hypothetical protein